MSCAISTVSSGPTVSRTVSGFGNHSAGKRLSFVRRSVVRRNASIFTSSRVASSSYLASADAHTSHLPCGISTVPRTSVVSVTLFIFHSYYGMLRPDQLAVDWEELANSCCLFRKLRRALFLSGKPDAGLLHHRTGSGEVDRAPLHGTRSSVPIF